MTQFEPFVIALHRVVSKSRPHQEALEAELASESGLQLIASSPLTEEQKQRLLFGRLFFGIDKPLNLAKAQPQVESPRAFVIRHKIENGTFTAYTPIQPVSTVDVKPLRPVTLNADFGIVRFGFISRHARSVKRRWFFNDRNRPLLFPGSPVHYLLGY